MSKEYITIIKENGETKKMQVVMAFKLESTQKKYIIYKHPTKDLYYVASYDGENDYSNLSTNFTEAEKEELQKVFESVKIGGDINA